MRVVVMVRRRAGGGGLARRSRARCKGSLVRSARCGHDDWSARAHQMYAVGLGRSSSNTSVTQLMKANMSPTQETTPPLPLAGASRAPCPPELPVRASTSPAASLTS